MTENLSNQLLKSFLPPVHRNAADWADANCYLMEGSAGGGSRWKCRPPQREILKNMGVNRRGYASGKLISEIVLLKSSQVGYSQMEMIAIIYNIINHPCNQAIYLPTNDMAKAYGSNQFAKFISAQPVLEGVIDTQITSTGASSSVRKRHAGGVFNIFSASKPADVSQHTIKVIYGDEIDSYKEELAGEGDPIKLIYARAREHADSLIVWGSSPRGDFDTSRIWGLYSQSDQRRYYMPCPHCGHQQYISWEGFVKFPEVPHEEAGFACVKCGSLMTEKHKRDMLRAGEWRPSKLKEGAIRIPGRAGYHLWAALSETPATSWPNLSRAHLHCGNDKKNLMAFINTTVGMPTSIAHQNDLKPLEITNAAKSDYSNVIDNTVTIPNDIDLLTMGVDQQGPGKNARLEYSLVGFSRDKIWFLHHDKIIGDVQGQKVWNRLMEVTQRFYNTHDYKKAIKPAMVFIDSGNGPMTARIYQECHRIFEWKPIKGHSTPGRPLVTQTTTPSIGSYNIPQPLYSINTVDGKDNIQAHLKALVSSDPSNRFLIPNNLDYYVAQCWCSEYRKTRPGNPPKVEWIKRGDMPNEALDTLNYALAAKAAYCDGYPNQDAFWEGLRKTALKKDENSEEAEDDDVMVAGGFDY